MPSIDLGRVVGPQGTPGKDGATGQQGKRGVQGDKGADAKINGVNSLTIKTGSGLTSSQSGNTFTIDTTDSVKNTIIKVETLVRPNLLDNWYFGNPVNQRGQSEYTSGGYTIDRFTSASGTIKVLQDSVHVFFPTNGTGYESFHQVVPKTQVPSGQYTASILTAERALYYITFDYDANDDVSDVQYDCGGRGFFLSFYAQKVWSFVNFRLFNVSTNANVNLLAAKLELGNTQTLAHQDASGAWILNEIPDYGEQLRRCQRYLRPVIPANLDIQKPVSYINNGKISVDFELNPPMRTTPVLISQGNAGFRIVGYALQTGQLIFAQGAGEPHIHVSSPCHLDIEMDSGINESNLYNCGSISLDTYSFSGNYFFSAEL